MHADAAAPGSFLRHHRLSRTRLLALHPHSVPVLALHWTFLCFPPPELTVTVHALSR